MIGMEIDMSKTENSRYLGEEKISKLIIKFSLPCILSLLVSALYNIVDQIFIGNSELSTLGNAAIGVVFPFFIVAQAFAWCFGGGCATYLNICQGRDDAEKAHKSIGSTISITLIISVVLMTIFYIFNNQLLILFGASENNIEMAKEYLNIILAFFPAFILSNMMMSVIRADGSPKYSMIIMVAGAVANIILDPIMIMGLHWGMTGAALATVTGQMISFIGAAVYFFRPKTFSLHLKSFIPSWRAFLPVVKIGFSTFVTQLTMLVITVVCNITLKKYGMLSEYGADIPIAVIGIITKVYAIVLNIDVGIILGCQPIISYNMGAKNYFRVKKTYRLILSAVVALGAVATLIFELVPNIVIGIFGTPTNIPNPDAYWEFAIFAFRIYLMFLIFNLVIKLNAIFFQAVGKPGIALIASVVRDIICFVPLVLILPTFMGIKGVLAASPIADAIAFIVTGTLMVRFMNSLHKEDKIVVPTVIKPSHKGVIITIARQHGSGGKQIGKALAEKMGIPFYYKEMTALAAQESGLHREFISDINADSPQLLRELYLSTEVVQNAVTAQDRIIKKIADNGSCVIVGRAADYVLRDYPDVFRVFVYAEKKYRAERLMLTYGDSASDASKNIFRSDRARSSYYKNISGLMWGDPANYDLMINGAEGIDECVAEIEQAIKKRK